MLYHLYFAEKDNRMQAFTERLDHFGLVAGVIKDLGWVEWIDERIGIDPRENMGTQKIIDLI